MKQVANEHLFAEERKVEMVKIVNDRKKVFVPELVDYFGVSPATIRNDLRELELLKLIKRTHGGAIFVDLVGAGFEPESSSKTIENQDSKQAIALAALAYIEDGDIIILDTGTTTLELAKLIKDKKNITVVVNDIEIARYLEDFEKIQVILIGGALRRNFHCTVGPFALQMLSTLNVDKVFLGTNGISLSKGCSTPDMNQAEIKKLMHQVATQVIVLCDSSKIGVNSFVQFAPISEIDYLITDKGITEQFHKDLTDQGIEVVIAK